MCYVETIMMASLDATYLSGMACIENLAMKPLSVVILLSLFLVNQKNEINLYLL